MTSSSQKHTPSSSASSAASAAASLAPGTTTTPPTAAVTSAVVVAAASSASSETDATNAAMPGPGWRDKMWRAPAPDPTAAAVAKSASTMEIPTTTAQSTPSPSPPQALPPPPTTTTVASVPSEVKEVATEVEEVATENIAEALHVGSGHTATNDTFDEANDDGDTTSCQRRGDGEEKDDKNKADGVEKGGDVDSPVILRPESPSPSPSPLLPQSQESTQNHHNVETAAVVVTAISKSLTRKLLASGGDIRALLLSSQPTSSLRAQTGDTAKKDAEQDIVGEEGEEEEDEDEGEVKRFVRPRRLRPKESKEAASDGFPSAIALSHRWHPDHMQDTHNLSIRAAFDTKYDEYYVFRHWRPSLGSPLLNNIPSHYSLPYYYLYCCTCHKECLRSMMCDCAGEA